MDVKTYTTLIELADKYGTQTVITIVCLTLLVFVMRWGGRIINTLISRLTSAVESKHTEAMDKLNNLTRELKNQNKEISTLVKMTVRHEVNLEHGDKRFDALERKYEVKFKEHADELKYLRKRCHEISNHTHLIKNIMVSKDQMKELLDIRSENERSNEPSKLVQEERKTTDH